MNLPAIRPLPAVMTTSEVAKALRCPEDTVVGYVHRGDLTAIQIGRERRFRAEDLLDFIAGRPATTRK